MRILIVGAGISGLSMALALEKMGFQPRIIEKYPSLRFDGTGIALPLNAVQMLFHLGLKDELMKIAYRVNTITYAAPNGEILNSGSLQDQHLSHYPFLALHRKDLILLLSQAINTKIEFNKNIIELINYENSLKKSINVRFSNNEIEEFDLVIAADGISSSLRSQIIHSNAKEDLGISTWRFIANFKESNPVYYFGKKSAFMIYPISENKVYCYAHIADKIEKQFSKHYLSEIFNDYCPKVNWIIRSVRQEDIVFVDILTRPERPRIPGS